MSLADTLRRAVAPRLVVGLSRLRGAQRLRAKLQRLAGQRPRIELYFAFDDPYAAIALPGLIALAQRHGAVLELYPLLERGIEDDPAALLRRRHAVEDARRLAPRHGLTLSRTQPHAADDCAFLAHWTEALRGHAAMAPFAAAALDAIWNRDAAPDESALGALHRQLAGREPASARFDTALDDNHVLLLHRGHWESPAARVGGEWFFAHERLPQIGNHLRTLGW